MRFFSDGLAAGSEEAWGNDCVENVGLSEIIGELECVADSFRI